MTKLKPISNPDMRIAIMVAANGGHNVIKLGKSRAIIFVPLIIVKAAVSSPTAIEKKAANKSRIFLGVDSCSRSPFWLINAVIPLLLAIESKKAELCLEKSGKFAKRPALNINTLMDIERNKGAPILLSNKKINPPVMTPHPNAAIIPITMPRLCKNLSAKGLKDEIALAIFLKSSLISGFSYGNC